MALDDNFLGKFSLAIKMLGSETPYHFVTKEIAAILHDEMIAAAGGASGIRDAGLLESALNKPMQLLAYESNQDVSDLAAALMQGIIKNHPFVDGNKRTAFSTAVTFLGMNGFDLNCDNAEAFGMTVAAAAGDASADDLAGWIRKNIQPMAKVTPEIPGHP